MRDRFTLQSAKPVQLLRFPSKHSRVDLQRPHQMPPLFWCHVESHWSRPGRIVYEWVVPSVKPTIHHSFQASPTQPSNKIRRSEAAAFAPIQLSGGQNRAFKWRECARIFKFSDDLSLPDPNSIQLFEYKVCSPQRSL